MLQQTRRYRVGISGSDGGLNLGDEAILQGIITQLRQSLPVEITVFSRDVEDTRRRHPEVEHVAAVRSLARNEVAPEVERCISGTHEAHSSYRVMPVAMATGQGAGVCAALASRSRRTPRSVPYTDVQAELQRQGADLRDVVLN